MGRRTNRGPLFGICIRGGAISVIGIFDRSSRETPFFLFFIFAHFVLFTTWVGAHRNYEAKLGTN